MPMTTLQRAALTGALLTSAIALGDAVWQATSDAPAPWTPGEGIGWVARTGEGVHGVTYALLAAALVVAGGRVDAGRRAVRVLRMLLVVDLGLLAIAYCSSAALGVVGGEGVVGAVMGVAFIALFVLAVALGVVLLTRRATRVSAAWWLASPVALIPLTVLAGTVGWAHPGYVETAVYLGLALLGAGTLRTAGQPAGKSGAAVAAA